MISILMPIYNGVEFFPESLESVINQTFPDWELIVGINGLPANSEEYQYVASIVSHPKVKIYDMPEVKGKHAALNKMLEFCKYEILCILDVDDIWHREKLWKQIVLKEKYDIICTNCHYIGDKRGDPNIINIYFPSEFEALIPKDPVSKKDIPGTPIWYKKQNLVFFSSGKIPQDLLLYTNVIVNSSSMFNKRDAHWEEDLNCLEDYEMWLRLASEGKTLYMLPEYLVEHRIHSQSFFNNYENQDIIANTIKGKWRSKILEQMHTNV